MKNTSNNYWIFFIRFGSFFYRNQYLDTFTSQRKQWEHRQTGGRINYHNNNNNKNRTPDDNHVAKQKYQTVSYDAETGSPPAKKRKQHDHEQKDFTFAAKKQVNNANKS